MRNNLFESILAEASTDDKQRAANRLFASTDKAEDIAARKASFEFKGKSYGIAARHTVTGWAAEVKPLNEYVLYENGVKTNIKFKNPSEMIGYILDKNFINVPDIERVNTSEELERFEAKMGEIISLMKDAIKSFELAKNINFDKAFSGRAKAFNDLA
jgi:hypothetical protein